MNETEETFFKGKRPWSKIKDNILKNYLPPYLKKLAKLNREIILIDAFAGPGIFENEEGSDRIGSPLIMCNAAEESVPGNYHAIFVNSNENHHQILKGVIKRRAPEDVAIPLLGIAQELLKEVNKILTDQTLFIYLDPFGLKECKFDLIKPFLERDISYSTEIIINMSMPTLHRLATRKVKQDGRETLKTKMLNETLTKVLGGDYWKEIMWSNSLSPEEKEAKVMEKYRELLKRYLPYTSSCPVREKRGKRVKYFITFCSRHPDATLLMNDIMCRVYFKQMYEEEFRGTLFEGKIDWRTSKDTGNIEPFILSEVKQSPGKTRKEVWLSIVQKHFMRWMNSEYIKAVQKLTEQGKIICPTLRKTKRLNDSCLLFPEEKSFSQSPQENISIKETIAIYLKEKKKLPRGIRIHYEEYKMLDGTLKVLVKQINEGSIITRFNKTPLPQKLTDVVCPHFVELKWAYGCPFDCSWCYLKGTFRFRPEGIKPVIKDLEKVKLHTQTFLEEADEPEILNTGELADSLMMENGKIAFSEFIIPLFESQDKHKILFVTKSSNVKHLLEIEPHNQVIVSFTLNALPVSELWEKKTPPVINRVEAARKLAEAGYEVRIRIDPMVPVDNWQKIYQELIDRIFSRFRPERITFGSLRGLQSTINGTKDTSWVHYLKETSNWGKKIDFTTRLKMYSLVIDYLEKKYKYENIALCKETVAMWNKLGMDYKKIKCNCVW